jgi:hypothetical protein
VDCAPFASYKRHLDFFALANLLIATTDKLHHVARSTTNDQEKRAAFVGLSDYRAVERQLTARLHLRC